MGASTPELRGVAQIGFHAQQAVEKLLKAFLTTFGVQPEDQHSLARLIEQVRRLDRTTADEIAEAASLTAYAVYHRYPPRTGNSAPLNRADVLGDLDRARRAFTILLSALETRLVQLREAEER